MLKQILTGIILIIFLLFFNWGKQPIAGSHHANTSVKPAFQTVTYDAVREMLQIVSSRSTASFGFNTPLVRIYLPRIENSAYAVVTFDKPQLMDTRGKPVAYELERGGYDKKLFADEIRFVVPNRTGTVAYAKAKGSGTIKYPTTIATHTVYSKMTDADEAATINGSLVTYIDKNIPDLTFQQSSIGPVRAYDATNRQLIMGDYNASQSDGKITRRTIEFSDEIAKVEIDTVTQWAEMAFIYELPPTRPLPESYRGHTVSRPPEIKATPGGKVSVTLIQAEKPAAKKASSVKSSQKIDTGLEFLHYALSMPTSPENEATIQQLIKAGADVNAKDDWGRMSLHLVAYRCDAVVVVRTLIAAGANVNAKTANGHTPLWLAEEMDCQENIRLLKQAGAK